jgi:predicted membrane protein
VAILLMVLGAVMIITARTDWGLSRRRWPVFLGAGLLVVLAASSSGVGQLSFGDTSYTYTGAPLRPEVRGGFGNVTVDLRRLGAAALGSGRTLTISNFAGNVALALPAATDLTLDLSGRIFGGDACFNGQRLASGVGRTFAQVIQGPAGAPTLHLRVRDGFGIIRIGSPGGC